jgi:hypothetical protein
LTEIRRKKNGEEEREEEQKRATREAPEAKKTKKKGDVIKPSWNGFGVEVVSAEAVESAKKGEFVRLVKFLPRDAREEIGQGEEEEVFVMTEGGLRKESRKRRGQRREIRSFESLTEAYYTAQAAYTNDGESSEEVRDWAKHHSQLASINKERGWEVALTYHEARRQQVLERGGKLAEFDEQLYQQTLRTVQPRQSVNFMSTNNNSSRNNAGRSNSTIKDDKVCLSWNFSRCRFQACRFRHVCAYCNKDHTAKAHEQIKKRGKKEDKDREEDE